MFENIKNLFQSNKTQEKESKSFEFDFDTDLQGSGDYKKIENLEETDFINLYKSWAYMASRAVSKTIAKLDYGLVANNGNRKTSPMLKLIDREVLENIAGYLEISGVAYIGKVKNNNGNIEKLVFLRPDLLKPVFNENYTKIEKYEYNIGKREPIEWKPENVITISDFNPYQPYPFQTKGISPIEAIAKDLYVEDASILWNWNNFKNGAAFGTIVESPHKLSEEQKERLVRHINNNYKGVNNAHKTAVLDQDLKINQQAGLTNQDADFVNMNAFIRDKVFAAFGVPKSVVGMSEQINVGNVHAFDLQFMKYTINPLAMKIEDGLNKGIFRGIGTFKFFNVVPTDNQRLQEEFSQGIITLNEYREEMGYPKEDEDYRLVATNVQRIPSNITENENKEEQTNTSTFKIDEKQIQKIAENVTKNINKNEPGTFEYEEERSMQKVERTNKYFEDFRTGVVNTLKLMEEEIINDLKNKSKKNGYFRKDAEFNLNERKYKIAFLTNLTGVYKELMGEEAQEALNEIGSSQSLDQEQFKEFQQETVSKFATSVTTTVGNQIEKIIEKGNEEGKSVDEITEAIRKKFDNLSRNKAEQIARTETLRAATKAQNEAWRQSGVVKKKQWFTAGDDRVCEFCGPMNGTEIKIEGKFFEEGEEMIGSQGGKLPLNYESVDGPPLHPECRCNLIPIT